jgi:hypothetical protein
MADKKRDILEFVEQSNFEQMIPTRTTHFVLGCEISKLKLSFNTLLLMIKVMFFPLALSVNIIMDLDCYSVSF